MTKNQQISRLTAELCTFFETDFFENAQYFCAKNLQNRQQTAAQRLKVIDPYPSFKFRSQFLTMSILISETIKMVSKKADFRLKAENFHAW